ncbi:hypothetical protein [Tumebacillus algifaecis]|uniref:hypothetical protein n=1 Tax=Tumebacillus algifaecis TaxID=1214604 RepID=UPI0012FD2D44|nr:hypothetical protein [Tumebacillus algifaecis]
MQTTHSRIGDIVASWNEDLVAANHLAEEDWLEAGRQRAKEAVPLVSMDEQMA